jgi:hypothetical protein
MKNENEANGGICTSHQLQFSTYRELLTERMTKGRGSPIRNNDVEGFLLGTQVPVIRSKPSYVIGDAQLTKIKHNLYLSCAIKEVVFQVAQ